MKKIKEFLKNIGPGFITGASDDDPSGITTYSQTGAQFGFSQLWTALFSFPFMAVVQEMCGRIGLVTGMGLSGVIRKYYSKKLLAFSVILLVFANTINIGADLGAMASALQLVLPLPFPVLLILITAFTLFLEIFVSYKVYVRYLKYFALSLLAYIVTLFFVKQDWSAIGYATFVPHLSFSKDYILNIVAILGTTISPYLFFWQSDEEVEEEVAMHKIRGFGFGRPHIGDDDIKNMRYDTLFGMFFSNLIMFFIIATAGSTLFTHGIHNINTAADAAQALRPFAGPFASFLFMLGIIGTGLLAVPVLAGSAAYAVSEAFHWKEGLYRRFSKAHGFYGVITIATIVGLLVNFLDVAPFKMLYYTAAVNGVLAPPLLVVILMVANNKKVLGKYVNSLWSNIFGVVITLIMGIAGIALLWTSL
jgi:NRAMP (natural resistance-associated macrophage protein)-like metal ion transporter